jgi:hypothetical protein
MISNAMNFLKANASAAGRNLKYTGIAGGIGGAHGAFKGLVTDDQNYSDGYGDYHRSVSMVDKALKGAGKGLMMGAVGAAIPGFYKGMDKGLKAKPFNQFFKDVKEGAGGNPKTGFFEDLTNEGGKFAATNQALKGIDYAEGVYQRLHQAGQKGLTSKVGALGYTAGEAIGGGTAAVGDFIKEAIPKFFSGAKKMLNSPNAGIDLTDSPLYSSVFGKDATFGNKAVSALGVGALGVGIAGGSMAMGFQASRSGAGLGHPGNATSYFLGGERLQEQYTKNKREQMRSESAMLSSPYSVGQRDIDSAYGYNSSLRPSSMPTTRGQRNKAGINPGQFGDTGNLVFGLHNMR